MKRSAPRPRGRKVPRRGPRAPLRGPQRPKRAIERKKRKLKLPKIPLKPRGTPPSYFELLQEAVLTLKEAVKGASLPEIRRQLQRKYRGRFDKASDNLLTTALKRLAERGKVICKEGYKYTFNAPKVSKTADPSASSSFSSRSGASQSGATTGSPGTNKSNKFPQDESPEKDDCEGKTSTGDLSSSAPSASSTASRASSKRR